ncbi:Increased recombination centers protein 19 [[Candida] zeylanoides]
MPFKAVVTKHSVIVSRSYAVTYESIAHLTHRRQLLVLYARFYRLRLYRSHPHDYRNYVTYLHRKFRHEHFEIKRQKLLGSSTPPLDPSELVQRLVNTLAFIQNASVQRAPDQETTMESQILHTVLRMEHEMPSEVKYDHSLNWLADLETLVSQVAPRSEAGLVKPSSATIKSKFGKNDSLMAKLGYRDYIQSLMKLNEAYKLCL